MDNIDNPGGSQGESVFVAKGDDDDVVPMDGSSSPAGSQSGNDSSSSEDSSEMDTNENMDFIFDKIDHNPFQPVHDSNSMMTLHEWRAYHLEYVRNYLQQRKQKRQRLIEDLRRKKTKTENMDDIDNPGGPQGKSVFVAKGDDDDVVPMDGSFSPAGSQSGNDSSSSEDSSEMDTNENMDFIFDKIDYNPFQPVHDSNSMMTLREWQEYHLEYARNYLQQWKQKRQRLIEDLRRKKTELFAVKAMCAEMEGRIIDKEKKACKSQIKMKDKMLEQWRKEKKVNRRTCTSMPISSSNSESDSLCDTDSSIHEYVTTNQDNMEPSTSHAVIVPKLSGGSRCLSGSGSVSSLGLRNLELPDSHLPCNEGPDGMPPNSDPQQQTFPVNMSINTQVEIRADMPESDTLENTHDEDPPYLRPPDMPPLLNEETSSTPIHCDLHKNVSKTANRQGDSREGETQQNTMDIEHADLTHSTTLHNTGYDGIPVPSESPHPTLPIEMSTHSQTDGSDQVHRGEMRKNTKPEAVGQTLEETACSAVPNDEQLTVSAADGTDEQLNAAEINVAQDKVSDLPSECATKQVIVKDKPPTSKSKGKGKGKSSKLTPPPGKENYRLDKYGQWRPPSYLSNPCKHCPVTGCNWIGTHGDIKAGHLHKKHNIVDHQQVIELWKSAKKVEETEEGKSDDESGDADKSPTTSKGKGKGKLSKLTPPPGKENYRLDKYGQWRPPSYLANPRKHCPVTGCNWTGTRGDIKAGHLHKKHNMVDHQQVIELWKSAKKVGETEEGKSDDESGDADKHPTTPKGKEKGKGKLSKLTPPPRKENYRLDKYGQWRPPSYLANPRKHCPVTECNWIGTRGDIKAGHLHKKHNMVNHQQVIELWKSAKKVDQVKKPDPIRNEGQAGEDMTTIEDQ